MKKSILLLLTLVPVLVGYLINLSAMLPVLGQLIYALLPLPTLVFWFWLGWQYAKTDWTALQALLFGSATGWISLALYVWQFWLCSDQTRNVTLAGLSQMYTAAAPGWLLGRLAVRFEPVPGEIGPVSLLALQLLSLAFLILVFAVGFASGRGRLRRQDDAPDTMK